MGCCEERGDQSLQKLEQFSARKECYRVWKQEFEEMSKCKAGLQENKNC